MDPLFPKLWTVLNFKVLTFSAHRTESRVESPASGVQIPGFRVQGLAFRVQHPGSSVHGPASKVRRPASSSCVQSPRIPINSQFNVVLNGMICFSVRFRDNLLLMLKMRFQVFSFASKRYRFSSDRKMLMPL